MSTTETPETACAAHPPGDTGRPSPMPDARPREHAGASSPSPGQAAYEAECAWLDEFMPGGSHPAWDALEPEHREVYQRLAAAAGEAWRERAEAGEARLEHAIRLAEHWAALALAEGPVAEKGAQAIRTELAALRGEAQDGGEEARDA